MTLPDIVAILANEPFNRSMEEIKRLTLFQVESIMFRPRDKETGAPRPEDPPGSNEPPESDDQRFVRYCAMNRVPVWYVKEKFASGRC